MAKTYNRQTRLPPSTGNTGTRDGDPMHSHVAHDLVYGLNNMAYTCPYWGFVHWPPGAGAYSTTGLPKFTLHELGVASSQESFLFQVPTVLNKDFTRFAWTLDFYHGDASSPAVTIDTVSVYISPTPYNGLREGTPGALLWNESDQPFDLTALGTPYGLSQYSTPISCTAATQEHKLVDMSAGTENPDVWLPFSSPTRGSSPLHNVWLVVAMERHTGGGALTNESIYVAGFSWWLKNE